MSIMEEAMKKLFFSVVAGIFLLTALGSRPTNILSLTPTPVPSETPSVDQLKSELATLESELAILESERARLEAVRQESLNKLARLEHEFQGLMLQRLAYEQAQETRMTIGLMVALLAGAVAVLIRVYFAEEITAIANRIRRLLGIRLREAPVAYKERIVRLVRGLEKTSAEFDSMYGEMAEVLGQREAAITRLQKRVENLGEQETQLQRKVETLGRVPLPAVDYFADIVQRGEKRSAWRDYVLFGLGVVMGTVVNYVVYALGK
jgi:prefoldin subunit 5